MGSVRVDGLESAYPGAAGYNLYSADGVTLFQHDGSEYRNITGAMKLTAWPGVTTRQTPTELHPTKTGVDIPVLMISLPEQPMVKEILPPVSSIRKLMRK